MRLKDLFGKKKKIKLEQVEKKVSPTIKKIAPYENWYIYDWWTPAIEVTFYVPGEDVQAVIQDPNYIEMGQSKYITDPIVRTKFYGYSNDAWLEEFRFFVLYGDWREFENQPYVLALKKHLGCLKSRYENSARHAAIDSQENERNETHAP